MTFMKVQGHILNLNHIRDIWKAGDKYIRFDNDITISFDSVTDRDKSFEEIEVAIFGLEITNVSN